MLTLQRQKLRKLKSILPTPGLPGADPPSREKQRTFVFRGRRCSLNTHRRDWAVIPQSIFTPFTAIPPMIMAKSGGNSEHPYAQHPLRVRMARLKRIIHSWRSFFGYVELTPKQRARLDEMEKDYERLVRVRGRMSMPSDSRHEP